MENVKENHQRKIYENLLNEVGLKEDPKSEVKFKGPSDPMIDSPYYIGEGFSALLGAVGMANSVIWDMKTGEGQEVTIDRSKAMPHLYRLQFIKQNDYRIKLTAPFKPTGRTHKCKDGRYIETLTTFRHLEDGMLELLDCANTEEAVNKAYANWDSYELQEEINKRGLCGTIVHTKDEWRNHLQGKALKELPVITIEKIADSQPIPFNKGDRPLSGIRVLDLAHIVAGPIVGNVLAEQGAEVLHINPPNREQILTNIMDTGFGKLSAYLDLDNKKDLDHLKDLVKDNTDIFVQSYKPGSLEKRGLSAEELAKMRPGIIAVDVSSYGHVGPWKDRKGWENLGQACTGMTIDQGGEGDPELCGGFLTDYSTGYFGALGALIALIRRAKEGGSYKVSVSLARTAMWYQDLGTIKKEDRKELEGTYETHLRRVMNPDIEDEFNASVELIDTETPFGVITHMAPVIEYSKTKGYWELPTVPLGYNKAEWIKKDK